MEVVLCSMQYGVGDLPRRRREIEANHLGGIISLKTLKKAQRSGCSGSVAMQECFLIVLKAAVRQIICLPNETSQVIIHRIQLSIHNLPLQRGHLTSAMQTDAFSVSFLSLSNTTSYQPPQIAKSSTQWFDTQRNWHSPSFRTVKGYSSRLAIGNNDIQVQGACRKLPQ